MNDYPISSRDYLQRAKDQLAVGTPASMFYAAIELRSGIESRMNEYLNAWDHIAKKNGWRITEIGRNIEAAFKLGNKVVRWAVYDGLDGRLLMVLYHTPVTRQLRKDSEKLGNYLHAMKVCQPLDNPWWDSFKDLLATATRGLELASRGTMLGPALMKTGTKQVQMSVEVLPSADPRTSIQQIKGVASRIHVEYLNALPEPLEPEAQVWYGTR